MIYFKHKHPDGIIRVSAFSDVDTKQYYDMIKLLDPWEGQDQKSINNVAMYFLTSMYGLCSEGGFFVLAGVANCVLSSLKPDCYRA